MSGALSRWWLDRSVRSKGLYVVALPLLALLAVTAAGGALQLQEREQRRQARAANAVASAAQKVVSDAVDAETGVRAYAGTTDPGFLSPYNAALTHIPQDVKTLRDVVRSDSERAQADAIAATVSEEFRLLEQISASVQHGVTGHALVPQLAAGKVIMDRLRAQSVALSEQPLKMVATKRDAIARSEGRILAAQVAGLVLGILVTLIGVALFTAGIARRVRLAADNADRLGKGQPLTFSPTARDELGHLNISLTSASELLANRLEELSLARDTAVRATQVKDTFLSRTSHELRTPLNAILGFAQLLELSDLEPADREGVDRILAAGRHLLALINDLIDTASIESGELRLSVEPVAVHMLTKQVTELIGPLAQSRQITVEHSCVEENLAVYADVQRLRQILVNLVSNAVKYNRANGLIRLTCRAVTASGQVSGKDSSAVEIMVTDSGAGLSPDDIARIFIPFDRLDAEQGDVEGSGIGLPLALGLSRAMGGDLTVDSTPGQGSTFTVRLPRAPDLVAVPDPSARSDLGQPSATSHVLQVTSATDSEQTGRNADIADESSGQTLRVLSIEDNYANSQMLTAFFSRISNVTLYTTNSGMTGIDLAQQHRPQIVLLDLHLPDLSGEDVLVRLLAEPVTRAIPIVVLSADATQSTRRRLLERGAFAYLTKPIDLTKLKRTIDYAAGLIADEDPSRGGP